MSPMKHRLGGKCLHKKRDDEAYKFVSFYDPKELKNKSPIGIFFSIFACIFQRGS